LQVDKKTGEIIWGEKKEKVMPSLAEMVKEHDAHKKEQESLFNKRSQVQKDRSRILEEKFKEAQKNVDKSKDIPLRDIDFD
jgi:vacuolar-type H+-ATPase subunit H